MKRRKCYNHSVAVMIAALALALASCQSDDTDMDDIIAQYQIAPAEIELDFTALTEAPDVPVTDETDSAYNDYVENTTWSKVIGIEYIGDAVQVTGSVAGVIVRTDGAHVTVMNMSSGPVKFDVSGLTANGSLKFYGDKRIQVLLNNVDITNPTGAAINNQGSKSMYVVVADGTTNSLQDGLEYTMVDEEDQKATLFSEGQMIFSGGGRLNVLANGRGGIRSDDYIRIRPGVKIYVNSTALDGLRANDGIIIDGGAINVEAKGLGAKGVRSEGAMQINGGRLVAISHGDCRIGATEDGDADTTACAALVCDTLLTVNGGDIRLKATGDGGKGLNAKQDVIILGGSFQAVATGTKEDKKPKGVKVDGSFAIGGGYFYTYSRRSDPLEVSGTTTVATGYHTYKKTAKALVIAY